MNKKNQCNQTIQSLKEDYFNPHYDSFVNRTGIKKELLESFEIIIFKTKNPQFVDYPDSEILNLIAFNMSEIRRQESRLNHINHDNNRIGLIVNHLKPFKFKREKITIKDDNEYEFLEKRNIYKDISLHKVLREMKRNRVISASAYKNNLARIKKKEPVTQVMKEKLDSYYRSLKQKREMTDKAKTYITLRRNGIPYRVKIKHSSIKRINQISITASYIKQFMPEYNGIYFRIEKEFQTRFNNMNKV